ncbi:transglycosylase SLT domain-containing protein [Piscinibacter sp.]|uniref:transglycosylase SLT domain-containing protein n=1 Tax=Piscinibacter sp. TaxID=1903157 RepID=UPI002B51BDF3|nr:transglycosylase SLT domain-containing protein [Albitalea sp.]HUG22055.1 transglycosylase SLT domain-containing protein [Albitalea sp.]
MTAFTPLRWLSCALCAVGLLAGCATPPPTAEPVEPIATADVVAQSAELQAPAPAASAPADASETSTDVAVPVPVDPLRPEEPVALDDEAAHADLWARLRRGFAMPDLDGELVRNREQWYATRPDYVQRMTERGSRYLFHILEEVERRGMPSELALLPFIESAFNPQAMSSAKASGMWQFIPSTGRHFDLKQNMFRDDRRDVLASTRAALDYLGRLHDMFGDWHLALAAYNWGEGSVRRAIARNEKAGRPTDYQSLRMPAETRYYVPKLQAVKNIVASPEAFSLTLPEVANHPYFLSVPITRDIDVDLAASLSGMALDDFKNLNPQMNRPVILAAGTPYVLLPYDNANRFVRALIDHTGPMATWTAWIVPKTMRPADAAKRVGMSEAMLREVNRIPPRMLVKAGSALLVPRNGKGTEDVSEHVADTAMMVLAPDRPPLRRISIKAGKKDTVASIAKRYRVSASQVAKWNRVGTKARFKPGQAIVVYVSKAVKVASPAKTSSTRKSASAKTTRQASGAKAGRPTRSTKAPVR